MKLGRSVAVGAIALQAALASAMAADTAAPVYKTAPTASLYNWAGWYGGFSAGYGWSNSSAIFNGDIPNGAGTLALELATKAPPPYPQPLEPSGAIGGIQFGYNWQFDRSWIAGIEADIHYSGIKDNNQITTRIGNAYDLTIASSQRLEWFGTLRGRLGLLLNDRLQAFITGGLAFGESKNDASISTQALFAGQVGFIGLATYMLCNNGSACLTNSKSSVSTGWTLGGGFEYAAWGNVSLKVEYLHIDLGDRTLRLTPQTSAETAFATAKFDNSYDIVRAGLNVRF